MLARSHDTAAVQLVKRPQIAMAGLLGINSSGSERIVNPLYYRPICVITLNHSLDVRHALSAPSSIASDTRQWKIPHGRTDTNYARYAAVGPQHFLTHPRRRAPPDQRIGSLPHRF